MIDFNQVDVTVKERNDLLSEGISEEVISSIETVFSVDQFYHHINWFEHEAPTLRLSCPKCGCEADVHLDAVTDFFCTDDQECGYDYGEPDENAKPLLA